MFAFQRLLLILLFGLLLVSGCNRSNAPEEDVNALDADGDQLLTAMEEAGWEIFVDYSGYGSAPGSPDVTSVMVTSDPELADTDGDGLSDFQEFQLRTHPRQADTDADGLTDLEEFQIWQTNPNSVDTDGDSRIAGGIPNSLLFDGNELRLLCDGVHDSSGVCHHTGTSPSLADTDGDGSTDLEEFDHPTRHPLIAELPKLGLDLDSRILVGLDVEYSDSTGTETQKSYSTTLEESTETTAESSQSSESSYSNTVGLEVGVSISSTVSGGSDGWSASATMGVEVTGSVEHSQSYSQGQTFSSSQTSAQSASETMGEVNADSQVLTETFSEGSISTSVRLANNGDQTFSLQDLAIAVVKNVRSDDGAGGSNASETGIPQDNLNRPTVICTLVPELEQVTLAPGEITDFVQVSAAGINPDLIKSIKSDPSMLEFIPVNESLTAANGLDYDFIRENTFQQTARLIIERGGDLPIETYFIATNVSRGTDGQYTGVSLPTVLSEFLDLDVDTGPPVPLEPEREKGQSELPPLEEYVDSDEERAVFIVDGAGVVTLGSLYGRGYKRGALIEVLAGEPQSFAGMALWQLMFLEDGENSAAEVDDIREIAIHRGETWLLRYLADENQNGLFDIEEKVTGISGAPQSDDNDGGGTNKLSLGDWDGDGISSVKEVRSGWRVAITNLDSEGTGDVNPTEYSPDEQALWVRFPTNVYSNPRFKDSDFDGLTDLDEMVKKTHPRLADTDGDTLPDGLDEYPLDKAEILYVRKDGGDDANDGLTWETAFKTITKALEEAKARNNLLDPEERKVAYVGQVWVAKGVYRGFHELVNGVNLFGGFQGFENQLGQRDPGAHPVEVLPTSNNQALPVFSTIPQTVWEDKFPVLDLFTSDQLFLAASLDNSDRLRQLETDFLAPLGDDAPSEFSSTIDGFQIRGENQDNLHMDWPLVVILGTNNPTVENSRAKVVIRNSLFAGGKKRGLKIIHPQVDLVNCSFEGLDAGGLTVSRGEFVPVPGGFVIPTVNISNCEFRSCFERGAIVNRFGIVNIESTDFINNISAVELEGFKVREDQYDAENSNEEVYASPQISSVHNNWATVIAPGNVLSAIGVLYNEPNFYFYSGGFGGAIRSLGGEVHLSACKFEGNKAVPYSGFTNYSTSEAFAEGVLNVPVPHAGSGSLGWGVSNGWRNPSTNSIKTFTNNTGDDFCNSTNHGVTNNYFWQPNFLSKFSIPYLEGEIFPKLNLDGANIASCGGALAIGGEGRLIAVNCEFVSNSAGHAGAVYLTADAKSAFTNCTFVENISEVTGVFFKEKGIVVRSDDVGYRGLLFNSFAVLSAKNTYPGWNITSTNDPFMIGTESDVNDNDVTSSQGYQSSPPVFANTSLFFNRFSLSNAVTSRFAVNPWNTVKNFAVLENSNPPLDNKPLQSNPGAILTEPGTETYLQNCLFWDNSRKDALWTKNISGSNWFYGTVCGIGNNATQNFYSEVFRSDHQLGSPQDPFNHVSGFGITFSNNCFQYGDQPVALLDAGGEKFEWITGEDKLNKTCYRNSGVDTNNDCWDASINMYVCTTWVNAAPEPGHHDNAGFEPNEQCVTAWDLRNNSLNFGVADVVIHTAQASTIYSPFTMFEGNSYASSLLVTGDPEFVNLSGGDLGLGEQSSCINQGSSIVDINPFEEGTQPLPLFDITGSTQRRLGSSVDLGAREYVQ